MVNILIHQFQPDGAVVDASALEQFQRQWATYQKLVDSDELSHATVGALLHDTLNQSFDRPFAFLDIACGDASQMRALSGTKVFVTTTGSIFPSRRSSSQRTISRTCLSTSSSTMVTSSRR